MSMEEFALIEQYYKEHFSQQEKWPADMLMHVDLQLLHHLDLLRDFHVITRGWSSRSEFSTHLTGLRNHYFNFVESRDKLTLYNEEYVVWLVPGYHKHISSTYAIVALNLPNELKLELIFVSTGIYNSSFIVLRVLEKLLLEIQENNDWFLKNII